MVKWMILLAVIVLLWMLLRPRSGTRGSTERARKPQGHGPQEIVACAHCGVHVPKQEALPGPSGSFYCCESHQHAARPD